ncbi:MAG: hypothetical protein G01um101418_105 [Parcubacteria group bacterium Gr01-1014_18]|nr:MAG: hypothetical protein Greene041636_409 [Parcubacteria group bacterium Greene0416_36]TSC81432.1 MAG: hypothetical protein G01um101418_105 [Parcubacteria group bacterium Gr01-1014_18]TSC99030.1 MAG: hypothetical protein Greene101420_386 [Parcubacteria group bacterium Greene1014_20]TSD07289.1 MAG: hypothetical protein Greene07142_305 [Parcubacteria group bacterium Greene0714_2]
MRSFDRLRMTAIPIALLITYSLLPTHYSTSSMFTIIKNNGQIENFSKDKMSKILIKLGAPTETINHISAQLEKKFLGRKIFSWELSQELNHILRREHPILAKKYNLRSAILRLGPTGFDFEKYVAAVLTAYGYKADLPGDLQGACVTHEVDVTVEKDGRTAMIEAKFRHNPSDFIGIKDTMSTWARYMDLIDGNRIGLCPHFDEVWIVTNAKFSEQSLKYGHCKNMVMIGWNHPHERTFAQMIDLQLMYPVTILDNLSTHTIRTLSEQNIMLCSQLARQDPVTLSQNLPAKKDEVIRAIKECKELLNTK